MHALARRILNLKTHRTCTRALERMFIRFYSGQAAVVKSAQSQTGWHHYCWNIHIPLWQYPCAVYLMLHSYAVAQLVSPCVLSHSSIQIKSRLHVCSIEQLKYHVSTCTNSHLGKALVADLSRQKQYICRCRISRAIMILAWSHLRQLPHCWPDGPSHLAVPCHVLQSAPLSKTQPLERRSLSFCLHLPFACNKSWQNNGWLRSADQARDCEKA